MKILKMLLCSLIVLTFSLSIGLPAYAEGAGGSDGGYVDSGVGGSNIPFTPSGIKISWEMFDGPTTLDASLINQTSASATHKIPEDKVKVTTPENTEIGAYIKGSQSGQETWFRWCWGLSYGNTVKEIVGNSGIGGLPDPDLITVASDPDIFGSWWSDKGFYYSSFANEYLDYVYVTPDMLETVEEPPTSSKNTSIVYATMTDENGDKVVLEDRRDDDLEDLYEDPTTSVDYDRTTSSDELIHNNPIHADFIRIKRIKHKKKGEVWYTYKQIGTSSADKKIKYQVTSPTLVQVWNRPYDLNRNDVAGESDVKSDYPTYLSGSPNLDMSVDNYQDITDGKDLQSLDTNTGTKFKVEFDNDQFGINGMTMEEDLPGSSYKNEDYYNPEVVPDVGSDGTYNLSSLKNGDNAWESVDHIISKYKYWNCTARLDLSSSNSSMTFEGNEKIGGELTTKHLGWTGGDFIFKTIKIAKYNLFNGSSKNWWESVYTQGKFYGYGISYKGEITLNSGIGDAGIYEKDLYARLKSTIRYQPLVRGRIEAKTVAGNDN